jgi:hypothetical protein
MNWRVLAGGLMALIWAAGHAIGGRDMFYRPITAALDSKLHAGVFTGMWHIITIHFTLSAIALLALGFRGSGVAVAWLVAAQFAGYALIYIVISLRLGRGLRLFQWMPFGATAILSTLGAAAER